MTASQPPRVEVLPIEQAATPDPQNVNKHTQRGGALLENSLRRRGAFRSIASAGKGVDVPTVYAGNYTLEKAVDAGFTEVVNVHVRGDQLVNVVRDDIAPGSAEAIALGLEDNESAKQSYNPDIDILAALAAGDSAILSALRQEDKTFGGMLERMGLQDEPADAEPQFDRAEELRLKWGVELGQLWGIGEHRLICGDCTDAGVVARVMGDEPADMVVTDPPYAIFGSSTGVKSEVSDDNLIRPFFRLLAQVLQGVIKTRGHAYICCDWRTFPTIRAEVGALLQIKNNIVWIKGSAGYSGSFYSNTYENVAFFVNEAQSHSMFKSYNEKGTPDHKQVYDANVWDIKRVPISDRDHFAAKPIELIERAVNNSSDTGMVVLDLFCGSGTTLVACENLSRRCRAIEISPGYVAVSLQRMADAFPGIEIRRLE